MLTKSSILKHYKRSDVQEVMIRHARNKEIGMCYGKGYGKRPDVLSYPNDILALAIKGVTSFHASEERWENPLLISSTSTRKELESLRTGWDLVLDIDCPDWEISKLTTYLFIKALEDNNVKDISCKFSGNKGFHIGVPFEAFPREVVGEKIETLFPKGPKKIAEYLLHEIITKYITVKDNTVLFDNRFSFSIAQLKEKFGELDFFTSTCIKCAKKIEKKSPNHVVVEFICPKCDRKEQVDKQFNKCEQCDTLMQKMEYMASICPCGSNEYSTKFNAHSIIDVDTVLISTRHLYRMPYSLHEKSGLVSMPIDPHKVLEFIKSSADPAHMKVTEFSFLHRDRRDVHEQSARELLLQALDFDVKVQKEQREIERKKYEEMKITSPIREAFFPPCMTLALQGMQDGKKRAVFMLSNFLGKIGWSKPEIESYLNKWNTRNPDPLRPVYISGQMHSFVAGAKLPPNCNNEGYAIDLGICKPDVLCGRIKNPVNYTLIRWKKYQKDSEEREKQEKRDKARLERETKQEEKSARVRENREKEEAGIEE